MTTGYIPGWGMTARRCDTCRVAAALLFCRPHAAFLCGTCDSNVHDHDPTRSRHERVWICDVCEQAPASVTCKADAAALCATCDRDIHAANPLAGRHERVPVVPFFHSAADAAGPQSAFLVSDEVACVVPPAPVKEVVENDWLIPNLKSEVLMADFMCNGSVMLDFGYDSQNLESQSFGFTDSVVPTKAETNLSFSDEIGNRIFENCCFDLDFSQPNKNQKLNHHQIFSGFNYSAQPSVSSSDIGVVPDANPTTRSEVSYTFTKSVSSAGTGDGDLSTANVTPAPAMDREARVMRYREKRKNRKFEKTIRYASRKAYAEKRPRIKGRFAKRSEKMEGSEIEPLYGFGSGFGSPRFDFKTNGFGVVPFFD